MAFDWSTGGRVDGSIVSGIDDHSRFIISAHVVERATARPVCEALTNAMRAHGVRLHDLRHFVATQLLSAGVDVPTVAGRLGHRNAATTLNVYAHFVEQTDRDAADIMVASSAATRRSSRTG